ncbi:MAG: metabolite traffic protein EboE [Verrucomicrobiota bacterium]|nr:metabolite traffic protein EboE [Verrucomicrobiota bacterium]MEE2813343.1 metabolite traffic protein EboE [Verrucomicrobiota bacterium]
MELKHGLHLAYCTNIHRGEDWAQTFNSLKTDVLAVRDRVSTGKPYAIGLRLSELASRELSEPSTLQAFQQWLAHENCYVFTINGFPFGDFHGTRVKEQVYVPDWTSEARLEFTCRLFDLIAVLVPDGVEGSVSTLPGSFKGFITEESQEQAIRDNLWRCVEHIAALSDSTGKTLHLGLEPEPLCWIETTAEVIDFFEQMEDEHPHDPRLHRHLGVNYDTCHLAVEYEEPHEAVGRLVEAGIRISKLHLSAAMKMNPTETVRAQLEKFKEDVYLHQVIERLPDGGLARYRDLDVALAENNDAREWRVHFHVPLHSPDGDWFASTRDHIEGVFDLIKAGPSLCSHLEMETYTWEVLPGDLKDREVVDQLVGEYDWTLAALRARDLV